MGNESLDDKAFKVIYPCLWVYALIGKEETALRDTATSILVGRTYTVEFSRKSAYGNYCAIHIEVEVKDEEERNRIYQAFKSSEAVKMVL
jgi:putative lipoic acid-binding regulatory protein